MLHATPLITTIAIGLTLAFAFGVIANRFSLPPLVGYLLAGVLVGPFTPGYVAEQDLAAQLAEIGVVLLMFGVGLHFSLQDLLSVRKIAIPGAIVQILSATLLGMGLAHWLGWSAGAGLVFGLALSVASTVVLLRAMQERHLVETERGRIAVGWLIVEDIAMVLALVLLPATAGLMNGAGSDPYWGILAENLLLALGKIVAFVLTMLIVGRRVIPWMLHYMAHTGSRELFRLAVLVIALGTAFGAAELFGVSLALGAFFAGVILSESTLSQHAAKETLPLRDAFAVLFFVSAGMLFDPSILMRDPLPVVATLLIILVGKSIAAYLIVRAFGYGNTSALTVAASLAQIGEFSFILAALGTELELLPTEGRDLIIAGAILSILLNPLLFAAVDRVLGRHAPPEGESAAPDETPTRLAIPATELTDHIVLVGHGDFGVALRNRLRAADVPLLVIESEEDTVEALREEGVEAIAGNAADPELVAAANLGAARCLVVAIPDGYEAGQVVEQGRAIDSALPIIARARSDEAVEHLEALGADTVVLDRNEVAAAIANLALKKTRRPGPSAKTT
ncbi:Inner membrane protein YbaL [Methyloligella halotolerans]|uniref:Inner membrane protein YbaL n=1 Tax=Methyloligella halotolerans TaxID=1177755 RepID=A0A1E2RUW9_9HYPH|nr:YbaL family putative K(+) efflux transporter [Methyloligella halotolerans]ODA66001.1 Inner membrane protein YbaL [Methyloligella halotolerans]